MDESQCMDDRNGWIHPIYITLRGRMDDSQRMDPIYIRGGMDDCNEWMIVMNGSNQTNGSNGLDWIRSILYILYCLQSQQATRTVHKVSIHYL